MADPTTSARTNFVVPSQEPASCGHGHRVPLLDYETTAEHADEDGDTFVDAVDFCLDCHQVWIWGVGWVTPPPLGALLQDGGACPGCGELLGEAACGDPCCQHDGGDGDAS